MSGVPGRLRAVVCRGMEQMQAVLVEAQRAQQACPGRQLNVLGASSLLLRLQPQAPLAGDMVCLHAAVP